MTAAPVMVVTSLHFLVICSIWIFFEWVGWNYHATNHLHFISLTTYWGELLVSRAFFYRRISFLLMPSNNTMFQLVSASLEAISFVSFLTALRGVARSSYWLFYAHAVDSYDFGGVVMTPSSEKIAKLFKPEDVKKRGHGLKTFSVLFGYTTLFFVK